MPRKDYPLWKYIHGNLNAIEAEVYGWSSHSELKQLLLQQLTVQPDSSSADHECTQSLISANQNAKGAMSFQFIVSRV
jgi:Putative Phosphatase